MPGSGAWRRDGDDLIDFMTRFTSSEQFAKVFREGMSLVEETADYLDGPGRRDSKGLDRQSSIAYATESMRLTTRLMQLASWLLLQSAVSAGEITRQAAESEGQRLNLADIGAAAERRRGEQFPAAFLALVERSLRLHERVMMLDDMIHRAAAARPPAGNPIAHHIDRLAQTFAQQKGGQ